MQTWACFPARCEGGCTSMRSESKILAGKGRALLVVNPCAGRTKGRLYDDPLFDFAASSAFHLKTEQGFDWSVDGERAAGGTAVKIACVKSAVRITVPARKD